MLKNGEKENRECLSGATRPGDAEAEFACRATYAFSHPDKFGQVELRGPVKVKYRAGRLRCEMTERFQWSRDWNERFVASVKRASLRGG